MFRNSLVLVALFISSVVAAQQTTVDKSTPLIKQATNHLNITAVAISREDAMTFVIDSANYHKAVQIGIDPMRSVHVVEITSAATRMNERIQSGVPKAALGEEVDEQGKEIIIKSDRAQPVKPQ